MTAKENCDTKKGQEEIQKGEFHFVTLRKWRRKKHSNDDSSCEYNVKK